MSLNKRIIIGLIIIILIIPASFLFESYDRTRNLNSGHLINMMADNKTVAYMGVDVIKSLTAQEFPTDPAANGPTLFYVMGAAGIGKFNIVEISGLDNAAFKTTISETGAELFLYPTKHGTVSLTRKGDQKPIVESVIQISAFN